jgi:hypothetical protein
MAALGRIAAVALIAAAAAWAIGRQAARRIERQGMDIASRRQPPDPGFPQENRTVANNNALMRMGFAPDLEGTAIAYDAEADRLVSEGRFRTDLSLAQLAAALKISAASIARPRSPGEVDPDAELFRAQSGVLTAGSKALARTRRKEQVAEGKKPDAVVSEWVVTEYAFSLNRLNHPSGEEKAVLAAIARAAGGIMPQPGDTVRAVGVFRGYVAPGRVALAPGMLPLAAQPAATATIGTERSAPFQ